jgi:hypothetical protein
LFHPLPDFVFCLKRWRKAMPFIHIKSLLLEKSVEMKVVLEGISEAFSRETEITLEHVTATWNFSCEIVRW